MEGWLCYSSRAVYNRSPSAYEELHMLKILQLPHSKTLKKVIRGGSEQSGIDEDYLQGQQQIYEQFKSGWEAEGHPRPLGIGVLMWDEVKVWRTRYLFLVLIFLLCFLIKQYKWGSVVFKNFHLSPTPCHLNKINNKSFTDINKFQITDSCILFCTHGLEIDVVLKTKKPCNLLYCCYCFV